MKKNRCVIIVKGIVITGLVCAIIIAASFAWFAVTTFSLPRTERPSDAIVVLTGGRGRVEEGIRLYRSGHARWLLLAGVDPSVKRRELFRDQPGETLADGVILEKGSRTTLENALYARDLLTSRGVRSIQLITSRYHMPRALLLFRQLLPREVAIYPYPVESRNLPAVWWREPVGIRLLFTEFYKYWLFRCLFVFTGELTAIPPE